MIPVGYTGFHMLRDTGTVRPLRAMRARQKHKGGTLSYLAPRSKSRTKARPGNDHDRHGIRFRDMAVLIAQAGQGRAVAPGPQPG